MIFICASIVSSYGYSMFFMNEGDRWSSSKSFKITFDVEWFLYVHQL